MSNTPKTAMISYKSEDRAIADEVFDALKAGGLAPWIDYERIAPGTKWRDQLLNTLRTCDVFVALLTRAYVQSEHCRMEIFIARSRGCPILPVVLDDCFDLLGEFEETIGLADTFMTPLYRLSVVGLPITRAEAFSRVVEAARSLDKVPEPKPVYVSYCRTEAVLATRIADQLSANGSPAWVATRDCRVGDHWRQAQARGIMDARTQILVLDDTILDSKVLLTELMLGEAFGLRLFTVLGSKLSSDAEVVAVLMRKLRAENLAYRTVADLQPFFCDDASLVTLASQIQSTGHDARR